MNLIIFLGSGASIPSRLPGVRKITTDILNNEFHMHTDSIFYKGKGQSYNGGFEKTVRIQNFLKTLKKEIEGNKYLGESNYEDLYYACVQICEHSIGIFENPLIVPFLKNFENNNPDLFKPISVMGETIRFNFKKLSSISLDFIQCVVCDSLRFNKEPVGFKLLVDILKSNKFEKNFIVTLNHDLLLEILLKQYELPYDDGFVEDDGELKYFNGMALMASKQKIQLLKLHGSLNWFRFNLYDKKGLQKIKYAKTLNDDHWLSKNGDGELLANLDGIPRFLTGTNNKLFDYTLDFYRTLQNKFSQMLTESNRIIVSGYGWNDIGINKLLFEWIDAKKENTITLLHDTPEKLKLNSRSALTYRFDELKESGKLILIKKWLCDVNLKELYAAL